jgi:hypothetical protein
MHECAKWDTEGSRFVASTFFGASVVEVRDGGAVEERVVLADPDATDRVTQAPPASGLRRPPVAVRVRRAGRLRPRHLALSGGEQATQLGTVRMGADESLRASGWGGKALFGGPIQN